MYNFFYLIIVQFCSDMEEERQLGQWVIQRSEKIIFGEKIGRGSQGSVYNGLNSQNGQKYAIKVMNTSSMNQKQRQRLYRQIQTNISISAACNFKYFPHFYGFWNTDTQTNLVFEKCQGNALEGIKISKTPANSYSFAYVLLYDILKGLQLLGNKNIIHRDLKPQNILLDKGTFKICDLGLSKVAKLGRRLTVDIGNIMSKSPQFYSGQYDCKTDVWSLGVNVFWIAFGTLPFSQQMKQIFLKTSLSQLFCRISKMQFKVNLGTVQTYLIEILRDMLKINKQDRLSAAGILQKHFPLEFKEEKTVYGHKKILFNLYLQSRQQLGIMSNYYLITFLLYCDFTKMDDWRKISKQQKCLSKVQILRRIKLNIYLLLKFIIKQYSQNDEICEMMTFYKDMWGAELNQDEKNKGKLEKCLKDSRQALQLHKSRAIGDKFGLMSEAVGIYLQMEIGRNVYLWNIKNLDLRRLKI